MPKIFIVAPTYNERENVAELTERIFALNLPELRLIIVDDNSPDHTAEAAEVLNFKFPITVLRRPEKQGLGPAYVYGFRQVLLMLEPDEEALIVEMDADLSHDPVTIPALVAAAEKFDVVIGSRYIEGGGIRHWNFFRRLISRFGNWYARLVLGLPYRDLTSGFKCYRREVIEFLAARSLNSLGYNFQIETVYRSHLAGFSIGEVPIVFTERTRGGSKFRLRIILEAFWKIVKLRLSKD